MPTPLFKLGQIVATPAALARCEAADITPSSLLDRHVSGVWGDLDNEDKAVNDSAIINCWRILSAYETSLGKVWIITEWDRSATTLLLPSDY